MSQSTWAPEQWPLWEPTHDKELVAEWDILDWEFSREEKSPFAAAVVIIIIFVVAFEPPPHPLLSKSPENKWPEVACQFSSESFWSNITAPFQMDAIRVNATSVVIAIDDLGGVISLETIAGGRLGRAVVFFVILTSLLLHLCVLAFTKLQNTAYGDDEVWCLTNVQYSAFFEKWCFSKRTFAKQGFSITFGGWGTWHLLPGPIFKRQRVHLVPGAKQSLLVLLQSATWCALLQYETALHRPQDFEMGASAEQYWYEQILPCIILILIP
jgi:hypothetical protein